MKKVYLLKADGDGTMRSRDQSFGVAVTSEEEAIRFVGEGYGYSQSYEELIVFNNKDDAIKFDLRKYK